jgi:hypothetical protein
MRKQYHLRASANGLLAWDVDRLIALTADLPAQEIPLAAIRKLDQRFWFGGESQVATCRMVADHAQLIARQQPGRSHCTLVTSPRKDRAMTTSVGVVVVAMLAFGPHLAAQRPTAGAGGDRGSASSPTDLHSAIAAADSALFAAFNRRDLITLRSFFTRDLEFYQDNEGVENYAQTMRDFGQMFEQPASIRRELVPGTFEVYPIKNYGAMEVGRHRFCHVENGSDNCGTFSFVHIWRRTKAGWKISRVVSYGH